MAILLSIILLSGYFYVIYFFSKYLINSIKEVNNKIFYATYSICLLLPGLLLMYILKGEKFVYYWDYSVFWHKSIAFTNDFFTSPFQALDGVYNSINNEEYNSLPNVLLAPANYFLGLDFNTYVFSIYLIYLVPFAMILSSVLIKLQPEINNNLKLALPFFILCFGPCLIPVRYGFLDAVGLVYISLVLSVYIKSNYLRDLKIKQSVVLGILLLLLIFNRRWYAFWFVAFYVSAFICNFIVAVKYKDRKILINTCINLFVAGIIPITIMLCFFYSYFEMTALKDYTDIYSAYRGAGFLQQAKNFKSFFGIFIIATAVGGLALSFKKEKSLLGFFSISSIIIVVLFMRVNDFGGLQHYYLLVPFFLIFFLQTVIYLSRTKYIVTLFFLLILINSLFVFNINPYNGTNYIFSSVEGKAFSRPDYNKIQEISDKVIELQDQGNYLYSLASAATLNDDIIKNSKLPDLKSPVFKLLHTQHLDKRDRFPNELFLANYVLTTLPVQLHLGAENQKVIAYFNHAIMDGDLKYHYEKVEEYQLQDNTKAYLMKKTASLTNKEIKKVRDYFNAAYPQYEQMYAINTNMLKSYNISAGDNYGAIEFGGENTIDIFPGAIRPSEISFMIDPNDKTLSFTALFFNKDILVSECNAANDGEVYLTIKEGDKVIDKLYITYREDKPYTLNLDGRKNITLIVDKGKNEDYCDWFRLTNFEIK